MNELNLSISTTKEGENRVVLNALFANQDDAVTFHSAVAHLCERAKNKPTTLATGAKLLGWTK